MLSTLFRNARIYTPEDPGRPLGGPLQGKLTCFSRGALLCRDGLIERVGPDKAILAGLKPGEVELEVDCAGRCLVPGFVDPHTHMCFAETREQEFGLRLQGVSYLEILAQGGGILSSVRSVRAASEQELTRRTRARALTALNLGTTTLEIKSGYGLDTESELKMLRVIAEVGRLTPMDVIPTFLGAHAIPEEYRAASES